MFPALPIVGHRPTSRVAAVGPEPSASGGQVAPLRRGRATQPRCSRRKAAVRARPARASSPARSKSSDVADVGSAGIWCTVRPGHDLGELGPVVGLDPERGGVLEDVDRTRRQRVGIRRWHRDHDGRSRSEVAGDVEGEVVGDARRRRGGDPRGRPAGRSPAGQQLARSAEVTEPRRNATASPVAKSVAITATGIGGVLELPPGHVPRRAASAAARWSRATSGARPPRPGRCAAAPASRRGAGSSARGRPSA